ncbi:DNA polymerase III subunit beta [Patescibacteria group bacterium]|nr:DNA polymerase III subunit beta [Patescibacteria group bacterium]
MKIVCLKNNILPVSTAAERFVGKNAALSVLSSVLLETKKKKLHISATDLEMAFEAEIIGNVIQEGKITVPVKIFNQIIQSIPDNEIVLEQKGNLLYITFGDSEVFIHGTNESDFPIIPEIKSTNQIIVPSIFLKTALMQVLPAVSFSEVKPEISGVCFTVDKNKAILAATDTFRLAEKTIFLNTEDAKKDSFIIPFKAAQELVRIIGDDADGEFYIYHQEGHALFAFQNIHVTSRLIDGNFPEYKAIIPTSFSTSAVVSKKDLIQKVKLASVVSGKLFDVLFQFSQNEIAVSAQSQELGKTHSQIKTKIKGNNVAISFNHRYFLQGIDAIQNQEEIFIGANSDTTPVLLSDPNDNSFLYIVMPIRGV